MTEQDREAERQISAAQIVIGCFDDPSKEGGSGILVIKGKHLLKSVVEKGQSRDVVICTLPCESWTQAEHYRATFGDGKVI